MSGCPHNAEFMCFDCETDLHDREHPEPVDGCRTCKFRTLQVSPAVRESRRYAPSTAFAPKNSWERGIAKDERGLPLLDGNLQPIPVKRYAERRHEFDARRKELATSPDPFGATKGA